MKSLLIWVLGLQILLSTLLIIAILWGQQRQPLHDQQSPFDPCGTTICFKGVIPEVTQVGEAISLLRDYTNHLPAEIPIGEDVVAYVSNTGTMTIQQISVIPRDEKPVFSSGWLIATFGIPCRIELDSPGWLILRYPFVSATIHLTSGIHPRITTNDRVRKIILHGSSHVERCKSTRIVSRLWKGFASTYLYDKYFK